MGSGLRYCSWTLSRLIFKRGLVSWEGETSLLLDQTLISTICDQVMQVAVGFSHNLALLIAQSVQKYRLLCLVLFVLEPKNFLPQLIPDGLLGFFISLRGIINLFDLLLKENCFLFIKTTSLLIHIHCFY